MMRLRYLLSTSPSAQEVRNTSAELPVTFAPMDMISDGSGGLNAANSKPFGDVASANYNYFRNGDVLLAKVTPCFENGKKALASGLVNGIGFATTEVLVLRPKTDMLNGRFLLYLLASEGFRAEAMRSMTGAGGLRRVSEAAILNHRPNVTDLTEQKRIADFLDQETAQIDALIEKNERLISLIEERKTAYLRENFTPSKGDGCRLRFVATFQKGRATATNAKDEGTVPLLTAEYIRHGKAKLFMDDAQPDITSSDVLILWDGAGAGDILNGREGVLSSTLARFIPNSKVHPEYLFYALKSREAILKDNAQGMGIPHVDGKILKNLMIKLPSMADQKEMAVIARKTLDGLICLSEKTKRMNALLQEKRSALITAAVTGQIDIPEE